LKVERKKFLLLVCSVAEKDEAHKKASSGKNEIDGIELFKNKTTII
jgi:hypothetical protein